MKIPYSRLQIRRGSAAEWNNAVLKFGELGYDHDNNILKIGNNENGDSSWKDSAIIGVGIIKDDNSEYIPKKGEIIYDEVNNVFKIGDGKSPITNLTIINEGAGKKTVDGGEIFNSYSGEKINIAKKNAHAEGEWTEANGECSHAEGCCTYANGKFSHAEGADSYAHAQYTHAEGSATHAKGDASHTEGYETKTYGNYSHAEGWSTIAYGNVQHVQGKYNIEDLDSDGNPTNKYAHIVGNGTSTTRSNAHTLDWNGNAWFAGKVIAGIENLTGYITGYENKIDEYCTEGQIYKITAKVIYDDGLVSTDTSFKPYYIFVTETSDGIAISARSFTTQFKIESESIYKRSFKPDSEMQNRWTDWEPVIWESDINALKTTLKNDIDILKNNLVGKKTSNGGEIFNCYTDPDNEPTYHKNEATAEYSHAEGYSTTASGIGSHAEGCGTIAEEQYSHAEGTDTKALGDASHAEGGNTEAKGEYSHTEGFNTIASGQYQHVQGKYNIEDLDSDGNPTNKYAHIVGNGTFESPSNAHTLDWNGNAWFAGDIETPKEIKASDVKIGDISVKEFAQSDKFVGAFEYDENNNIKGEIFNCYEDDESISYYTKNKATGDYSHAEGQSTNASGICSHAEGSHTTSSGNSSHAEGLETTASKPTAHAEGENTYAEGISSHAEGGSTKASGDCSHSEGWETIAKGEFQHVQGKLNKPDIDSDGAPANKYAHIVGNGDYEYNKDGTIKTDSNNAPIVIRSNAHTLDWNGNAWFAGDIESDKDIVATDSNGDKISLSELNNKYIDLSEKVAESNVIDILLSVSSNQNAYHINLGFAPSHVHIDIIHTVNSTGDILIYAGYIDMYNFKASISKSYYLESSATGTNTSKQYSIIDFSESPTLKYVSVSHYHSLSSTNLSSFKNGYVRDGGIVHNNSINIVLEDGVHKNITYSGFNIMPDDTIDDGHIVGNNHYELYVTIYK